MSDSDVFPDSMTNAKVINKCVCEVMHNNRFSEEFEYPVLKKIGYIVNRLGIKTRKGRQYAQYEATLVNDGFKYKIRSRSQYKVIPENAVLTSEDGKRKIAEYPKILSIKGEKSGEIKELDFSKDEMITKISFDASVFVSLEMKRLMAKIAYEWFCLQNEIEEKLDCFEEIILLITEGKNQELVSIVCDEEIYGRIYNDSGMGSHTIFCYEKADNSINVVIDFFSTAVYIIELTKSFDKGFKSKAAYQLLTVDADNIQFSFADIEGLEKHLLGLFDEVQLPNGQIGMIAKNMGDTSICHIMTYWQIVKLFINDQVKINELSQFFLCVRPYVDELMSVSLFTKGELKRFVSEYRSYIEENGKINPLATKKDEIWGFYILYVVGSDDSIESFKELNNAIKKFTSCGTLRFNSSDMKDCLHTVLEDENHIVYIRRGMSKILGW